MIQEDEKFAKRHAKSSYIMTVFSITLVLFLLGLQTLLVGYAQKISDYVKENIGFTVVIKDYTKDTDIVDLQTIIDKNPAVKSSEIISKEQAAKELSEDLGEDFLGFIGFNPLLPSIDVRLNAAHTNIDSIVQFEEEIKAYHIVKEIYYQKDMVSLVNSNIKKIGYWVIGSGLLILLIAIALINNTMRLLIYSKRFLINSMQLVGATSRFIRKPFLVQGFLQGFISATFATLFLFGLMFYVKNRLPDLVSFNDMGMLLKIYVLLIAIGCGITFISTFFCVNRYLNSKNSDHLYK